MLLRERAIVAHDLAVSQRSRFTSQFFQDINRRAAQRRLRFGGNTEIAPKCIREQTQRCARMQNTAGDDHFFRATSGTLDQFEDFAETIRRVLVWKFLSCREGGRRMLAAISRV